MKNNTRTNVAKRLLMAVVLSIITLSQAWAYDFSVVVPSGQTLYFIIRTNTSSNEVAVTYPNSSATTINEIYTGYTEPTGNLVIPSTVTYNGTTYTVTGMGTAFANCEGLTSVTIPNTVTYIALNAFRNCTGLTSATLSTSLNYLGERVFQGCTNLSSVNIPNNVDTIRNYAFYDCSSLTSVTIPNSVTSIGEYAFYDCSGLTSVTIPDSVTFIGECVFDCIGIKLPKRYTEDGKLIAYKAFNVDMTCRDFQYEEGKIFEIEGKIRLCGRGFHACTNPLDVFNYYDGVVGKDIHIHEVYLSGDIDEYNEYDSKVCASKIEIGRKLTVKDINEIINSK